MMLPRMRVSAWPLTPEVFFFPVASISAVFVHVGTGSPASNEVKKS